jgi:Cation transporter/ATPase, N-terminus
MSTAKVLGERTEAYQRSVDEVLLALDADARRGLSEEEVRARLEKYSRMDW